MTELKTLKDIADDIQEEFDILAMNDATIRSFQKIKQEAIKWVKHFGKYGKAEEWRDIKVMRIRDFMHFFNITEADLKELKGGDKNGKTRTN